ncbi:tetratricopeptide repeat protein [Leadbettera azotonutricia]|uniref:Tetratricopeptide repeat domain protein n=1 Tax=Leadbettera azotonutricia (strain ATCC BAA-888 / DSM 13862 / ZAS-9) TaxID=545695 RepID=F5YFE4_LEAAZ|nr:tetratricopeptide repeat protein [Leadbettera azotonutricia]AEF81373.1 tetratricopeptide repeat domain protein [Leadbettera azotonutricia ZAS-9]
MRKFLIILCIPVFFFSCRKEKEIPFSFVPLGTVSSEHAAALAEAYARDTAEIPDAAFSTNTDNSVSIAAKDGTELLRVYSIADQWIIITPEGYYDDSIDGASLLSVVKGETRYTLDQLFESLYRPDLVLSAMKEGVLHGVLNVEKPKSGLAELLKDDKKPPILSDMSITANIDSITVNVAVTDNGGGTGILSVFGRNPGEQDELLALYAIENAEQPKYSKVIPLNREFSLIGVSAFNHDRTIESEQAWMEIGGILPSRTAEPAVEPGIPGFYALFAGNANSSVSLENLFAEQEQGSLYSKVNIRKLENSGLTEGGFSQFINSVASDGKKGDVLIVNLPAQFDSGGDFIFNDLNKWDLLEKLPKISTRNFLILLHAAEKPGIEEETAFARLRKWLAGKGMALVPEADVFPESVSKIPAAMETPRPLQQFFTAHDFLALAQGYGDTMISLPSEDFNLFDPYPGYGVLRMQTMASGTIAIEGFDMPPLALTFGETLSRRLPGGTYTVTMTFRNGHKETKSATLKGKGSEWLIFTYVPDLLAGDLRGMLPGFGVYIDELNPANYNKYEPVVLKQMELPIWNQAFLAGEELYKKGSYDGAIAEYNKAISFKNDYTGAYVSRGNSYRRKGDAERAIADYTRALKLKSDYAEIYNYRGYLYCQKGDHSAAIADFTQAIKFRSNYADAFFNRAYAYGKLKDWDKTITDYSQVIKLEPKNAIAYNQRAGAYLNKGDSEKAEADFAVAEKL